MPRLGASEYATRQGCADVDGALDVSARLERLLRGWYEAGRLAGFRVRLIRRDKDFEYYALELEIYDEFLNAGALPFVSVNVTYDLESDRRPAQSEMAAVVQEFGLQRLAETAEA